MSIRTHRGAAMKNHSFSIPIKTALLYTVLSTLYIYFSDRMLPLLLPDAAGITTVQTYKGFAFVVLTGIIFFVVMRKGFRLLEQEKRSRLETDAKLFESETRYSLMFANSGEAVLLTDQSGKIHAANPFACKMFGRSEEELCRIGRAGIVDEHDPNVLAAIEKRKNTGLFKGELNLFRSDGSTFPADVSTTVYTDMNGNERTSMIIRDLTEQKRAEKILHDSLNRYRSTLDTMLEGCQILDFDLRYLYLNAAADRQNRRPKEELLGHHYTEMWPGIEQTTVYARIKRCVEDRTAFQFDNEFIYPDGTHGWFELSIQPIPEGVFILSIDITQRKRDEIAYKNLNRTYRVLSNINQLIVRAKDIDTIFKESCRIAVHDGGFLMAWIGLKDTASNKITVAAYDGFTKEYLKTINIDLSSELQSSGPTGRAVRAGTYQTSDDIEHDPAMEQWRSDAQAMGYKSSAAFPLSVNNEVIGAFSFYSSEKDFFTRDELDLLSELTMDISYALQAQRTEEERNKYYSALSSSEEKYRSLIEISSEAIFINQNNSIVYLNPEALRLFGFQNFSEVIGRSPFEFFHSDYHSLMQSRIESLRKKRGSSSLVENKVVRADGTEIEVEVAATIFMFNGEEAIQVVMRDISERKKAEKALRESESHYRLLADNISDVLWIIDLEQLRFTFCSPSVQKLRGYTVEEVLQQTLEQSVTPSSLRSIQEKLLPRIQEYLDGSLISQTYHDILEQPCKDGSTVWTEVSTSFIKNKRGTLEVIGVSRNISDRIAAEKKFRENEERLRLSLQAGHQGWFDLNIQTGEAIVSNEYATMIGYDPGSFIETNNRWLERLHPDDREKVRQTYVEYVAGLTDEYRVEFRQRTKSGEWKWTLSLGKIYEYTADGLPLRMLGTHTDIDKSKLAEEMQLLQTTALESAANGIVITTLDGSIVWFNNAFTKITGYTLDELKGKNPRILKSGKQPQEFYEKLWAAILAGRVWQGRLINKRKDGSLYIDESTITPVKNAENKITHFIGVKQDVTEHEKSINQIEEQAMLLDEAFDAIVLRDMEFRILYWNKGAERMYGWSAGEVLGKSSRDVLLSEPHLYEKEFQQLFATGKFIGEMQHCTKARKEITVDIRFMLKNDPEGRAKSILSIATDITEKKNVEQQFLRTQRMESLGTLAGGIAHDLNNVLAPILLSMQYLRTSYPEAPAQKILDSVEASAQRGSGIVKQILSFARGMESKKSMIQARHLMDELVKVFKETFPRSITIVNDIPKTICAIHGDPTLFHQLIMNLAVNARDAMPNGGTLSFDASNVTIDEHYTRMNINAVPGRYVKFIVSDTGSGMTPDVMDRMFEPFFTTKEIGKGTGLGLSTVHSIVKNHNGFIDVKSVVGNGTTFFVYLPASNESQGTATAVVQRESLLGNGELILVVDDEQSIREVTKEALELSQYTVMTASEGTEAVGKYAQFKSDIALVITDMMMPIMDGKQLIVALRRISPSVKIIASSGLVDQQELNVDGFIEKPYTAETLLLTIKKVLSDR